MYTTVFNRKVEYKLNGECWEVVSHTLDEHGYPRIFFNGKNIKIHRALYMEQILNVRTLDPCIHILHSCDNPACINPAHLRAGTPADNAKDRDSRGRTGRPRGRSNYMAKLTKEDVIKIRELYSTETKTMKEIGRLYNVSKSTISCIINKRTWNYIL